MKKIGVLLFVEPYGGGAFQYNQSILDALASLPEKEYKIFAYYVYDDWKKYLNKYKFVYKKVSDAPFGKNIIAKVLRKISYRFGIALRKNVWLWKRIDLFGREFREMDLMIFPSQEVYAGIIPGKSISVIHDLMHRYENFPEVCADGIFESREILYRNICDASELIFVDSEIGRQQVVECYGERFSGKLRVMPFTPPQYLFEEGAEVTRDFINALPSKFVFYPAQFWEHKNHKNLILAIKCLKDKGIDIKMIFVGSKKNGYDSAIDLIKELRLEDNISVLGYVDDASMRYLYKHARAMIMASKMGPTNIPPLEGMAMGCPVAVADVYAMPWQVEDAGLVFDPYDVESMTAVIEKLWTDDDLCEEMKVKGLKQIENFTQEKFNERFVKYVREALNV